MSKRKKKIPPVATPVPSNPWDGFALVRIRHPDRPGVYYNADNNGAGQWVPTGYSIWDLERWKEIYGPQYPDDGRNWDFFGEVIEVWPKGYSPE